MNEDEIFEEILDMSGKYIQLDSSGRVHLRSRESLRAADAVVLYLLGRRLARDANLCENDAANAGEVSDATGLKRDVAIARLNELKKLGKIESPERGIYRVFMARAHAILSDIKGGEER